MRSIKVRVLMTVIMCTLLTAFICGGVSVFNSSKTVYEDSKKELQYACENQAAQLDRKMGNVEQAVTTVHQVALQQLADVEAFKDGQGLCG